MARPKGSIVGIGITLLVLLTGRIDSVSSRPAGDLSAGQGMPVIARALPAAADVQQLVTCLSCAVSNSLTAQAATPIVYYIDDPVVVQMGATTNVTLTLKTDGTVTTLAVDLEAGGILTATALATDTYRLVFTPEQALFNYSPSYNHNFVGYLRVYVGATLLGRYNLFINVSDAAVPSLLPLDLAPNVRAGIHVVNLLMPAAPLGVDDADVTNLFYQFYPDTFDFINVVYAEGRFENRYHIGVSNAVQGIGVGIHDSTASYGSGGRLLGITHFPISTVFDGAEDGYQHELGHQWINFVLEGEPHWPISELAQGIMGFSIPGSGGEGGDFPYELAPNGDGSYTVHYNPDLRWDIGFTDLDLYLMGLLPAAQVEPALVFTNQDQAAQLHEGGILQGPTYTVDANTIIASYGARVPAAGAAQRNFRVASIIVTRDRLLTPNELAFFDYMAARASLTQPVPYSSGFVQGTARPFFLTTRGLGTLDSYMLPVGQIVFLPVVRR